jgi:hypothetical protein
LLKSTKQIETELNGPISKTKTKQLFFNADNVEPEFHLPSLVAKREEVRKEEKRINPFALIEDRNAEMDRVRREAALISDANQILVKGPQIIKEETVSLENLPAIVRQMAVQAKLKVRK